MRLLVTGAAGYIGTVLVGEALRQGHAVRALDNLSSRSSSLMAFARAPSFEFIPGDVRSESDLARALEGVSAILPLAAVVGMSACDGAPGLARETNVDAIRLLLKLRDPGQRIVFPNTNSGYGTAGTGVVECTEETPLEPVSLYGKLKAEAEALVLAEKNAVSVRLATVFGVSPRMRKDLLVNFYVWQGLSKRRIEVFEGAAMRNFVHVQDVAEVLLALAVEPGWADPHVTPEVYNLGNDAANLSKWALARKIGEVLAVPVSDTTGTDPDRRNYIVSSKKLRAAGVEAHRSLDDGIAELVKAYRADPELYA